MAPKTKNTTRTVPEKFFLGNQRETSTTYDVETASNLHKPADFIGLQTAELLAEKEKVLQKFNELQVQAPARLASSLEATPERAHELSQWRSLAADSVKDALLTQSQESIRKLEQSLEESGEMADNAARDLSREMKLRKAENDGNKQLVKRMEEVHAAAREHDQQLLDDYKKEINATAEKKVADAEKRVVEAEERARSSGRESTDQAEARQRWADEKTGLVHQKQELDSQLQSSEYQRKQLVNSEHALRTQLAQSAEQNKSTQERLVTDHESKMQELEQKLNKAIDEKAEVERQFKTDKELADAEWTKANDQNADLQKKLKESEAGRDTSMKQMTTSQKEHGRQMKAQKKEHDQTEAKLEKKITQLQQDLQRAQLLRIQDKEESELWNRGFATSLNRVEGAATTAVEAKQKAQEEAEKVVNEMKQKVDEAQQALEECKVKLRNQTERTEEAEGNLGEVRVENDRLTQYKDNVEEYIEKQDAYVDKCETEIKRLMAENVRINSESDSMFNTIQRLQNDLTASANKYARLQRKDNLTIDRLRDSLDRVMADKESALDQLDKARDTLQPELSGATKDLAAVRKQLENTQNQLAKSQEDLEDARSDLEDSETRLVEAEEKIGESENQLADANNQIEEISKQCDEANNKLELADNQLAAAGTQISHLDEELAEKKTLIEEMNEYTVELVPKMEDIQRRLAALTIAAGGTSATAT